MWLYICLISSDSKGCTLSPLSHVAVTELDPWGLQAACKEGNLEVANVGCCITDLLSPSHTLQRLTYQSQPSHLSRPFRASWKLQLSSLTTTKSGSLRFYRKSPSPIHLFINLTKNMLTTCGLLWHSTVSKKHVVPFLLGSLFIGINR